MDVLLGAEKRGSGGAEPPGPLALVTERPGRDLVLLPPVPPRAFPLLLQRVKEEPAPAPPLAEVRPPPMGDGCLTRGRRNLSPPGGVGEGLSLMGH